MMEPGKPAERFNGSERVRSVGGLWTLGEGQGTMPDGAPVTSLMTLGYDPQQQRFVGTFIASAMPNLWVYSGSLDAAGRVLTLDTEGPLMGTPKIAKFRDIIEFKSDDHRLLSSQILGDDGKWTGIMTAHYRRTTS